MILRITKAEDECVLRFFLKQTLGLSTRTLARLKSKENGILLNGEHVTVRAVLHEGDTLSLAIEDEVGSAGIVPRPIPVEMLFEDESLAVCHKPPDMPTHPSHGHFEDTLANALAHRYRGTPFVFRAITRLDRETSGAVLVAKDPLSAHRLSLAMKEGKIQKSYFALVHGETPPFGRIALPIQRREGSVMLRETSPDGAPAETLYRTLASGGGCSLVAVFPQTGRTHQIRLHLSVIGHPLCGDALYGREGDGFDRTMLHAARLSFLHPQSGKPIAVYAPPNKDFLAALSACALHAPSEEDAIPDKALPFAFTQDGE